MGCRVSPEYHQKWMEAQNFFWALSSMVFGDFFEDHVSLFQSFMFQELLQIPIILIYIYIYYIAIQLNNMCRKLMN